MSKLKIGSIITGLNNTAYSITNEHSLCMVVGTPEFYKNSNGDTLGSEEIAVLVLARNNATESIGAVFPVYESLFKEVDNINIYECLGTTGEFNFIDAETFENILNESCIRFNETTQEFETYTPEVIPSKDKLFDVPVELTDEEKHALINDTLEYLKSYGYQAKEVGTTAVINEWLKKKAKLINMFKQHPNYNGRFQIVTENEFERRIDLDVISEFKNWLSGLNVTDLYYEPVVLGKFSYTEAYTSFKKLGLLLEMFDRHKVYFINGNRRDYYFEQYKYFEKIMHKYKNNPDVYVSNTHAYDQEKFSKKIYYNVALEILRENRIAYTANNDIVNLCEKYISKDFAKVNQPMIEIISNLLDAAGISCLPDYENHFQKLKYTLTSCKDKYHTILSVHPIDFLSMGHGTTWTSPEAIDKVYKLNVDNVSTNYCGSTISYMLDDSSMVFYTVNHEYTGTEFEKELKAHRNVFHYNDSRLLQDNMYPNSCCDSNCDVFEGARHIVQKMISTCVGMDNKWILKRGYDNYRSIIQVNGKHMKSSINNELINVSTLKSTMELDHEKINIGANGICFNCGKTFSETGMILCRTHHKPKVVCKECHKSYIVENCNYVTGNEDPNKDGWYCKHHSFYCYTHSKFEIGAPAFSDWTGSTCQASDKTNDTVKTIPIEYQYADFITGYAPIDVDGIDYEPIVLTDDWLEVL